MRRRYPAMGALIVIVSALVTTKPSLGLERALDRIYVGESDWNAGGTCTIQYWNTCIGWVWTWRGWSPHDRIGVHFSSCGEALASVDIFTRFTNGVPVLPCWGFSGTLEAYAADENGCPTGPPLASRVFLPNGMTQNVAFSEPVAVPTDFVATVTMQTGGSGTARYGTDRDVAGPTGPPGCGTCFPTTRLSHSYYYGKENTPLCPGSKLQVTCECEFIWTPHMTGKIEVETSSWGEIKNLYR